MERVLDSRLWPKSLPEKLRKALSSQGLVGLDNEQGKTGKYETELIGPEDILMTKSQGEPNS